MKITQRNYSGKQDKALMSALARQFAENNLHVIDLPYRLSSWALDDPENVRLWFDERGGLLAWAVFNTPFWTIDYACHADAESAVFSEIPGWADQHAKRILGTEHGHPCWFFCTFSGQTERMGALERAGFQDQLNVAEDPWSKVLMRRSGDAPVKVYQPPAGFIVRPLAGEKEAEQYVELHRSVFGSKNMTLDWRRRTIQHPNHRPELDLVIESPSGELVAFCICWFNKETKEGHVEPLGCHQDFRQYALGRIAFSEGLHRLQALGAQSIFLETDSYRNTAFRLYESFDFQVIQDVLVYRKDYGE